MKFISRTHMQTLTSWFHKNTATGETSAQQLNRQSAAQQAQEKEIEALLDSVNNTSQHVRNFYITFLLVGFYIAAIIWSTTDLMLLKETPIKLPILDLELPITGFYWFAPFFYLLLHFNLLLQLSLLSEKLHRFDDALSGLPGQTTKDYFSSRLFSFAFTHTLSGQHHSTLLRFLLVLMVWITIIWLPLGLLIGLQVGFLAYHSETVLLYQRLAIAIDLAFLAIFWPIIRSPTGSGLTWIARAFGLHLICAWIITWLPTTTAIKQLSAYRALTSHSHIPFSSKPLIEGGLSMITLGVVIIFSWGIAVLPDSENEKWVANWIKNANVPDAWLTDKPNGEGERYFFLTEYLFDRIHLTDRTSPQDSILNRNLILREQLLIANKLLPEDEADLTDKDKGTRELALKKVTGLILSGRDLRYADFSEARLPKVDFVGANEEPSDLSHANFDQAKLPHARMNGTILQYTKFNDSVLNGAELGSANLQDAKLNNADLQGAELNNANFQDATLNDANIQYATLFNANLQGANMGGANLQGATLNYANLQGAELNYANLQGATLNKANLQGAELNDAKLQGAKLFNANLQGANMGGANLQDAELLIANLQDANLNNANLQGANLYRANLQDATLNYANLQGATLNKANLQGAELNDANLQGAELNDANLQGANMGGANLQGAELNDANLQGAKLKEANLQGAELNNARLTLANLSDARFEPITDDELEQLFAAMSYKIEGRQILTQIKAKLSESVQKPTTLVEAHGKNIWVKEPSPLLHTILYGFGNTLEAAKDETSYQNDLAAYLINLSCQDQSVATGIIRHRIQDDWKRDALSFFDNQERESFPLKTHFAQCLLELKDQKNKTSKLFNNANYLNY